MIEISGKYTNATVMIDYVDENCIAQIIRMINHPAFVNPVVIMPDTHSGEGSVIGFTMKMGEKLIANIVGVDIACALLSYNIGKIKLNHKELDDKIREKIPFGMNIRKKLHLNFEREINWSSNTKIQYSWERFVSLCKRIQIDPMYAQQSVGTLGSGNHFIELGISEKTGDTWVTVHSGSRNLGKKICEYWQDVAFKKDVPDIKVMIEIIKNNSKPQEIEKRINVIKEEMKQYKKSDLDWIDGEDKQGYIEDMKFASWYASLNRTYIMHTIIESINNEELNKRMLRSNEQIPWIESIHNYIDFQDNIIRKGAIRSYIGERMVIPFNMRDGILICGGKSNPDWNFSAPHGAGRVYSRSKAKAELNLEKFEKDMDGIFSTSVGKGTIDECPDAYKDSKIIEEAIQPTAIVLDRIVPIHNMKDISDEKPWKKKGK